MPSDGMRNCRQLFLEACTPLHILSYATYHYLAIPKDDDHKEWPLRESAHKSFKKNGRHHSHNPDPSAYATHVGYVSSQIRYLLGFEAEEIRRFHKQQNHLMRGVSSKSVEYSLRRSVFHRPSGGSETMGTVSSPTDSSTDKVSAGSSRGN